MKRVDEGKSMKLFDGLWNWKQPSKTRRVDERESTPETSMILVATFCLVPSVWMVLVFGFTDFHIPQICVYQVDALRFGFSCFYLPFYFDLYSIVNLNMLCNI